METRISHLEAEIARLQIEVASLKASVLRLPRRDPRDLPLLLNYLVVTAVLLAALWHGFGWI
jgi:hypothetical protein